MEDEFAEEETMLLGAILDLKDQMEQLAGRVREARGRLGQIKKTRMARQQEQKLSDERVKWLAVFRRVASGEKSKDMCEEMGMSSTTLLQKLDWIWSDGFPDHYEKSEHEIFEVSRSVVRALHKNPPPGKAIWE